MSQAAASKTRLIRVGHSPDPDDAFMFYALAHEKIPMRGFAVEHLIEDIESLNQRAMKSELEVTAVSCHAYAYLADKYLVKRCGASVGDQYGPILVARKDRAKQLVSSVPAARKDLWGKKIAIPGKLTTAYLALQIYEKNFTPVFIPFDQIFDAVEKGEVDLGLVIHEGQITHKEKGFEKVLDLGVWWDEEYKLPLPLGLDVIRRDLGAETIRSFTQLFKESIEYALAHRKEALEYALEFGRGISENLGDRFVGMYVNHYTVELGDKGEKGLRKLLEVGHQKGILPKLITPEFVEAKGTRSDN